MATKPKFTMHADGAVSLKLTDGFANFITGLGHADLKASGATYVPPVDCHELESAYRTSTWFGKIVDIPAEDATREWRTWQLESDDVTRVEAEERRLKVQQTVLQALKWSRLYGGAVIVMGGLPGDARLPVNPNAIRRGSLKFLTVLSRHEITCGPTIRNPMDPNYGQPEYYEIFGDANTRVHPSRIVPFNGPRVANLTNQSEFWGDPIWFRLSDAIKSADQSGAVIDALLQEAKVDVLRVEGMTKGLATQEYERLMIRRFQMVAILKGMQNVMLLDKSDEWEQKQITWTGLPDIAKHILNILSGASDIPMFRLTGQNLTGLSNTGEAEQRAYYDSVRSKQNLIYRPALAQLDEVLVRSALGNYPPDIWYEWNSLYQMTEKEKADIDKIESEAVANIAATGLVPSEALAKAVQARMIESGRWAALEGALAEVSESEANREREMNAAMLELLQQAGSQPADPANANAASAQEVSDAAPRPLYVRRQVKNWRALESWAKGQGFKTTLGADMHVTVLYSKTPVDWMEMGASWEDEVTVAPGGPRMLEAFGDNGEAKVLLFSAPELKWRHESMIERGATSDYPEYQAHITISWDGPDDLDGIEPYQGRIVLGPEIFEEIDENWRGSVTEDSGNGD